MKKALNLLLGLSLMASAYAKPPAVTPTIASSSSSLTSAFTAPVSPIASVALQGIIPITWKAPADSKPILNRALIDEYLFAYDTSFRGMDDGEYVYFVTIVFLQVTSIGVSIVNVPEAISLTATEPIDGTLDFATGIGDVSFSYLFATPPSGSYPITTSVTSLNSIPIEQTLYSESYIYDEYND